MATLASIENSTWGVSTIGYGVIAEGIAIIRQRILIVIKTSKRSDPLRPHFGSDVYKYLDVPVNIAVPNIKAEIIKSLGMWMPEIKVTTIYHRLDIPANLQFEISYEILEGGLKDKLILDIKQGIDISTGMKEIILQAFFPPNPNSYRYQIKLIKNSEEVEPRPTPGGYLTIAELFQWVQANWFFYGRWHLLSDKVIVYMDSEGINNATLSISVLPIVQLSAIYPQLEPGESYQAVLSVNGSVVTPEMPLFESVGDVLQWAQTNWSQYGSWFIEGLTSDGNSIFSQEFSDEFSVLQDSYKLVLISEVEGFSGELQINPIS